MDRKHEGASTCPSLAGSLSRSALVSASAGAHCTPMHGLFTMLLILFVLLFLTPAFRPMPRACLASIVFMAVKSLFDTSKARFLYKVKTTDFVAWCTAFVATLLLGVQLGIGAPSDCAASPRRAPLVVCVKKSPFSPTLNPPQV